MPKEPAISLDGVWKRFRRGETHDSLRDLLPALLGRLTGRGRLDQDANAFWALEDVTFSVGRGEAVGIIGPNGAGKSTILKLLSNIMRPDRGQLGVRGRISSLIEIGAGFHSDLTGRENIYLNAAIMGMSKAQTDRRFDDIVAFAEVGDFIDTPIKRYSSGMQARLGFSVGAHIDPDVLLVDEVLSVGDMSFQNRCLERMTQFRDQGRTIVFISHNMQAVARMCPRVILLDHGRILCDGPANEAIAQYLKTSGTARSKTLDRQRATIGAIELTTTDGHEPINIRPGTPLRLRAKCRFHALQLKR